MRRLASGRVIKRAANVSRETCYLTTSKQCDVALCIRLGRSKGGGGAPKKLFHVSRETPPAISTCFPSHPGRIRRQVHPPKISLCQKHCYPPVGRKFRQWFHVKQCLLSRRVFRNHQIAPANPIESKPIRNTCPPKVNVSRETFASRCTSHASRHSTPPTMCRRASQKSVMC